MTSPAVAIVVRNNSYGLTQDAALLQQRLQAAGVEAVILDKRKRGFWNRLYRQKVADTIIHLERVFPAWLGAAPRHLLIPNQERFPKRHLGRLKRIDQVLAKTEHGEQAFAALGMPASYLGFTSPDRRDASAVTDWKRFFHLAGGSTLKGTEDILALWARHPEWPELVLVQKQANAPAEVPANVTLISGYLDDSKLRALQNACGIHLCPSRSEGWGHNIVEAMSCGALVITSDAPPMNEHVTAASGLLVACTRSEPRHLGRNFFVDPSALEATIQSVVDAPVDFAQSLGKAARARFEEIDRNFTAQIETLFTGQRDD